MRHTWMDADDEWLRVMVNAVERSLPDGAFARGTGGKRRKLWPEVAHRMRPMIVSADACRSRMERLRRDAWDRAKPATWVEPSIAELVDLVRRRNSTPPGDTAKIIYPPTTRTTQPEEELDKQLAEAPRQNLDLETHTFAGPCCDHPFVDLDGIADAFQELVDNLRARAR